MQEQSLVVAGNLSDGFSFFGPFEDIDAAIEWAETANLPGLGEYWLATLAGDTGAGC